ncbi:MAG: right-handed parallel beta-helix repeat-containing protein [Nanoarchaeota archaeon]|nr:right-handed parallel beta-helix repeat-containing protein [Nanoarchaeota archaeon]
MKNITQEVIETNQTLNTTTINLTINVSEDFNETIENETITINKTIIINETNKTSENLTIVLNETINQTINITIESVSQNITSNISINASLNITQQILENFTEIITTNISYQNITFNETSNTTIIINISEENETQIITDSIILNISETNHTEIINETLIEAQTIIIFNKECKETCLLENIGANITIIIEVENATVILNNITYQILIENNAPQQIKEISDIFITNNNYTINLSEYFYDSDGDKLTYDAKEVAEIKTIVEENMITFTSNNTGNYSMYVYATDGEELVRSNEFNIEVLAEEQEELLNETINITPKITSKKHFSLKEKPEFEYEYINKAEYEKIKDKDLKIDLEKHKEKYIDEKQEVTIEIYSKKGHKISLQPEIIRDREGKFRIEIPTQRSFKPGKYTLKIELIKDGETYIVEQDFTWGVLAINTHKSIYLENETANIGIAVLDDEGRMVCDAEVLLEITSPDNETITLSTSEESIIISPECEYYGVTNMPDYYTYYNTTNTGLYEMILTALTRNGERNITDNFQVEEKPDYDVVRKGPTRIYPPAKYMINFTIKANKNHNGEITEYVPANFEITPQQDLSITTVGDTKKLTWNKQLKKGETYEINYEFDAPDKSPEFYILGALEIGEWTEARQWQIASDAPIIETLLPIVDIDSQCPLASALTSTGVALITVSDDSRTDSWDAGCPDRSEELIVELSDVSNFISTVNNLSCFVEYINEGGAPNPCGNFYVYDDRSGNQLGSTVSMPADESGPDTIVSATDLQTDPDFQTTDVNNLHIRIVNLDPGAPNDAVWIDKIWCEINYTTNYAPVMNSSRISPTTAYINDTLVGYCNATDADGDDVSYYYKWYKDNTLNSSGWANNSGDNYTQGVEVNVANVSDSLTSAGENWTLSCLANDGIFNSSWLNSSIIIQSSLVVSDANAAPQKILNGTNVNITANITTLSGSVDTVIAQIYYPNETSWQNATLTNGGSGDIYWNDTVTAQFYPTGTYIITIWVNNSIGEIDNSQETWFAPYLNLTESDEIAIDGNFADWGDVKNVTDLEGDGAGSKFAELVFVNNSYYSAITTSSKRGITRDLEGNIKITFTRDVPLGSAANYSSYVATSADEGNTWTFEMISELDLSVNSASTQTIVIDSQENIWVFWSDAANTGQTYPDDVYYNFYNSSASTWKGEQAMPDMIVADRESVPSIGIDSNDNLHVSYSDRAGGLWKIGYRYYNLSSGTWSALDSLSGNSFIANQNLVIDRDNNVHISYRDIDADSDATIAYRFRNASSGTWNAAEWAGDQTQLDQATSDNSIVVDSQKTAHILYYQDEDIGDIATLRYSKRYFNGTWEKGLNLSELDFGTGGGGVYYNTFWISADIEDNIYAMYKKGDNIYYRKYDNATAIWETEVQLITGAIYSGLRPAFATWPEKLRNDKQIDYVVTQGSAAPYNLTYNRLDLIKDNFDIKTIGLANNQNNLFIMMELNNSFDYNSSNIRHHRVFISNDDSTGTNITPDSNLALPFKYDYMIEAFNSTLWRIYNSSDDYVANATAATNDSLVEISVTLSDLDISSDDNINLTFETGSYINRYDLTPDYNSFISYTIESPSNTAPVISSVWSTPASPTETDSITIKINVSDSNSGQTMNCSLSGDLTGSNTTTTNGENLTINISIGTQSAGTHYYNITCSDGTANDTSLNNNVTVTTTGDLCNAPVSGNWDVTSTESCSDQTITMNGNVTITGSLTLDNITLIMNSSTNGEFVINNTGTLNINNSNITSGYKNGTTNYEWWNFAGSSLRIENTDITYLGYYGDSTEPVMHRGLYIGTNNSLVKNNRINSVTYFTYGVYIYGGYFNNITGNNVTMNPTLGSGDRNYGIALRDNANNNTIINNRIITTRHYSPGIYLRTASNNNLSNNIITVSTGNDGTNGITIEVDSLNNYISYNNITTTSGMAISISSSAGQTLKNNLLNPTTYYDINIAGSTKDHFNQSIDTTNKINNKTIYYYFNEQDTTIKNTLDIGIMYLAWSNNVTITNNTFDLRGLRLYYTHNTSIDSNNFNSSTNYGWNDMIRLQASNYNNISNNNITLEASLYSRGIYLEQNNYFNKIINNTIKVYSYRSPAVQIRISDNNTLTNNNITTYRPIQDLVHSTPIRFTTAFDNVLINNFLKANDINTYDIYSESTGRNYIINNTFNKTKVNFSNAASKIYVQWYLDVNVTDVSGAVENANVTGYNNTNNEVFSELTTDTGFIVRQTLTEYVQNYTGKYYETNYTINTTANNYVNDSRQVNLTNSMQIDIVLTQLNLTPTITGVWSTPTSPTNTDSITIKINVTDNNTEETMNCSLSGDLTGSNTTTTNGGNLTINISIGTQSAGTYYYNVTCSDGTANDTSLNNNVTVTTTCPAYGNMIVVCQAGGCCNATTIQEGINLASQNWEVRVIDSETYNEDIIINKTINLTSNATIKPTINGTGNKHTVNITAHNTKLSRFIIRNFGEIDSINNVFSTNYDNLTIENNQILRRSNANYPYGMSIKYSKNNIIRHNSFSINSTNAGTTYPVGIYLLYNNNTLVYNNTIRTIGGSGYAIYLRRTNHTNISHNHLEPKSTSVHFSHGIMMYEWVYHNNIEYNTINILSQDLGVSYGLYLWNDVDYNNFNYNNITASADQARPVFLKTGADNNNFSNNIIFTSGGNTNTLLIGDTSADDCNNNNFRNNIFNCTETDCWNIKIEYSENNTFYNDKIYGPGTYHIVIADADGPEDINTFINVTYDKSKTGLSSGHNGATIVFKWYLDVNVSNSSGAIEGANITGYNNTNNEIFSELTAATGFITRQTLTEYTQNYTNKLYQTNYTLNTTADGYTSDSRDVNLTESKQINILLTATPSNTAPTITSVQSLSAQNPTDGTTTSVEINFTVQDTDSNHNHTSTSVSFTKDAVSRTGTCSNNTLDSENVTYNCSVDMQYYDLPGSWTINVSIEDDEGESAYNDTTTFTYNYLYAFRLEKASISFSSAVPGTQGLNASDDPQILNNTGNANFTYVNITGYDLAFGANRIGFGNFTVNATVDSAGFKVGSNNLISGATLPRNSTQYLYIWLDLPTSLLNGTYTTNSTTQWLIEAYN